MRKAQFFIFLIPLFLFGCEEDNPGPEELPPITTTGENTFACRINGKNWSYERGGRLGGGAGYWVDATTSDGISITASNESRGDRLGIDFLAEALDGNLFEMNWPPPPAYQASGFYISGKECPSFILSNDQYALDGRLQILRFDRLDDRNRVIAGTFEFTYINLVCGDTVQVKDGRFDLTF